MKKFFFDCGTREAGASAGLLILRLGFGLMMLIGHGWGKIAKFEAAKDTWPVPDFLPFSMLTPPLSMASTILAEVGCAALLVLGLATRPAAFVLGFTMVVGAFQVHAADPLFMGGGPSKEPALLYLFPCLALIAAGSGQYSLDAVIHRERRRRLF